jgi:hypothetical protein
MLLNTLALLAAFAAAPQSTAAPAAPRAAGAVMSVAVEVAAAAGAAGQQWGLELRTALEPRRDEFRPARKGEKPELVVKVESVARAPKGGDVMSGALVVGTRVNPFSLTYSGEIRPQAEKLAGNLRRFAEQTRTAPPPAPRK